MNYRHLYHAGGFTDVFKHCVLIAVVKSFLHKSTAFCYIDTHAGAGFYDLATLATQKNKEYSLGIEKILHQPNAPPLVRDYYQAIDHFNQQMTHASISSLQYYPGSPVLVSQFLRPHDRMILTELHPLEGKSLKNYFNKIPNTQVQLMDGYQALKAFLPPKERRGLIFIDPPYERPQELQEMIMALTQAYKKFINGVYVIWYPIKNKIYLEQFYKKIKQAFPASLLKIELTLYPPTEAVLLSGSGMLIINPPWQINEQISEFLPFLWKKLSHNGQGNYCINFL